jgi:hypothetical protein
MARASSLAVRPAPCHLHVMVSSAVSLAVRQQCGTGIVVPLKCIYGWCVFAAYSGTGPRPGFMNLATAERLYPSADAWVDAGTLSDTRSTINAAQQRVAVVLP